MFEDRLLKIKQENSGDYRSVFEIKKEQNKGKNNIL